MRRALDELGVAGVALNTSVLGRALVEPGFEPVFAELNRRGAVLYLHPAGNSACSPLIGSYHLTWMVGATTPRSPRTPPGPSLTTTPAPCSASDSLSWATAAGR
jgi:hypothetical protein